MNMRFAMILLLFAAALLGACRSKPRTAEESLTAFFGALVHDDKRAACELLSSETMSAIEGAASRLGLQASPAFLPDGGPAACQMLSINMIWQLKDELRIVSKQPDRVVFAVEDVRGRTDEFTVVKEPKGWKVSLPVGAIEPVRSEPPHEAPASPDANTGK